MAPPLNGPQPQRSGPVTLLAGSHSSADTEPFFGEARNIGVWPLPAGSWGWDMIGVVMGIIGVVCLPSVSCTCNRWCTSALLLTPPFDYACSTSAWAQRSAAARTSAPALCFRFTRTLRTGRRCQAWSPMGLTGRAEVDKACTGVRRAMPR
jgi:hypothetical protein